ncbi:hypothetical protein [Marivita sp. GX14005]|uniref:hypothetical protein n=1 Tax=Marivita sp. GX14005 TaxID=2942276 RepID=UPI0020199775|nr:hypothetical protein [Marivita sp. GX14005]MCL3882138.1 hypothetical protein [Marivita sp. GX14005]
MAPDTSLVLGLALGVLSLPAIVSAISQGRSPRVATVILILAGGFIVYALSQKPGGYALEQIPAVVARVLQSWV